MTITSVDSLHTGSADSRWLVAMRVGPSTTHGDGAPRARSKGVTGAGVGTVRFGHRGESCVEKPRGNDFPVDGSPRDRATGRSRVRVKTRPADLGRDSPETDRQQAGFPLSREAAPFTARRMSRCRLHPPLQGWASARYVSYPSHQYTACKVHISTCSEGVRTALSTRSR